MNFPRVFMIVKEIVLMPVRRKKIPHSLLNFFVGKFSGKVRKFRKFLQKNGKILHFSENIFIANHIDEKFSDDFPAFPGFPCSFPQKQLYVTDFALQLCLRLQNASLVGKTPEKQFT